MLLSPKSINKKSTCHQNNLKINTQKIKSKTKSIYNKYRKLITEIKIHKNLNHKNVVQFDHVF